MSDDDDINLVLTRGERDRAEAELAAACADLATLRRAASAYRDAIEGAGANEIVAEARLRAAGQGFALYVALRGERREGPTDRRGQALDRRR